jgi:hypothetical protein
MWHPVNVLFRLGLKVGSQGFELNHAILARSCTLIVDARAASRSNRIQSFPSIRGVTDLLGLRAMDSRQPTNSAAQQRTPVLFTGNPGRKIGDITWSKYELKLTASV